MGQTVHPDFESDVLLTKVDQIPRVHPWSLKRSFPKLNNVPSPRAQTIVKNVPFPACSRGQPPGKPMISALSPKMKMNNKALSYMCI